eukprot:GILI01023971.1.p1 GENE.GILI01023971.1~~GILI01023971.1.p1  ORF type:complete len:234 (+),score=69.35 GILI01023971.1:95-703(+)
METELSVFYGPVARMGGSDGYLEFIFRRAALVLFGVDLPPSQPLEYKQGRNADFKEVTLTVDGEVKLRFAAAYGFRNIQNLIRKMKRGQGEYHFVEVMACPGGCLQGGGQIKPPADKKPRELLEELEVLFHNSDRLVRAPEDNPIARRVYLDWIAAEDRETSGKESGSAELDGFGGVSARRFFHTSYRVVEKTLFSASSLKW